MGENFPLDDVREKSVSTEVLCIGANTSINRLPHKYPDKAICYSE